jgi:hypothetical protein
MGKVGYAICIFVEKPEGERPLGRLRLTYEDNVRMDLREMGGGGLRLWTDSTWGG